MDFGSLLHAAKRNENCVKKEVKCYKSTFEPPKKEQKSKALSANIQKFLARKEEEERKKVTEAKKKKDELLALRSQDVKAKKRVTAMLKRTKAANKAAIEDAVDNENTAVTLGGLVQPDEDDYGYVSQEASAFYNKLMEKYSSMPSEEPKFSKKSLLKSSAADLNNTKDRVRMALLRKEEEEMMPHKRKRKTKEEQLKETESGDKSHSQSDYGETKECVEEKPEQPAKVRRPRAPPPVDFCELLKIAEKKQFEPIKIAPKLKEEDEGERPMTKKQRIEYMKEKEWRMRKEGKLPPLTASKQLPGQDQQNNQSRSSEERSRDRKSNHPAADSNRDPRYNCPSADKNTDQRNGQLSMVGQREQMGSRTSVYGNKDQMSGRFSDQRIGHPSGDMSRDQRNSRPSEGSRNPKNDQSSGHGNLSIPRIPNVNSIRKDEKSQHRIPKCNDIDRSNNRGVKLQGNSDGKVCKERNRDVSGKLPVKSSHASSSSASGHGSANRNSVEKRKDASSSNNNDSSSKNYNLSGYSKKLQESLLAKLQEKEKSGELSEAKKLCVPGAQNSKLPKNHDSGSFDFNRGPKPQSKVARSSDSRDAVRESFLGKHSVKPFTSSQRIDKTPPGVLSSKSQDSPVRSKSSHQIPSRDAKYRKMSQVTSSDIKHRQFPPPEIKARQVPSDGKPRQFAPPDVKSRQLPLQGVKPRQFPPADGRIKPKPPPNRRIEDPDEEYDSELDDFIDDGPDEAEDYSKHIKEIFGYDKSRYKDMDDDECMVSSFSQQLKEEFVSTKMGILEDLEDMEMEKREVARKKKVMMMKKNRRL